MKRLAALLLLLSGILAAQNVPRVWDPVELASFELPLVHPERSPRHASPDYYYRIPERPIYKSYPISLEDWLDPDRPATVAGHPFGLHLTPQDRAALIKFLRTL